MKLLNFGLEPARDTTFHEPSAFCVFCKEFHALTTAGSFATGTVGAEL
jgi:hypothetical protein